MKNNYNAAMIGCGNIAGKHDEESTNKKGTFSHAGAYTKAGNIRIIAASDLDSKRLAEFAAYWSVERTYPDYISLLENEKIDILSICTPDATHYQVIMDALTINPPGLIFAEKPLAETTEKISRLLALSRETGTKLVVDYQRRWDSGHRKIKDRITAGELGTIQAVSLYYVKGITHIGCTAINTLQFLFGDIRQVMALPPFDVGTFFDDPSLDAVVFFENGSKAIIQSADKQGYNYSIFEIDILGSDGRVRIVDNGDRVIWFTKEQYHNYSGFFELSQRCVMDTDMPHALEYGVASMKEILDHNQNEFDNNGIESYRDMVVVKSILESKQKGGIITDVPQ